MFGLLISKESKPSKEGKAAKNSRSAPTEIQGIVEYYSCGLSGYVKVFKINFVFFSISEWGH